jgi:RNA polymerase sigma factor (sigma-70 family)
MTAMTTELRSPPRRATLPPFQALVDAHGAAVHRFLRVEAGPECADDCFQETFLAALRAYGELRDASNLRGWLFTIAHRKAVDHHRRRARAPLPAETVPEPAVERRERDDALWAAVRALPPKQRTAVGLRYVGDLAYADIARALSCSEDAARQNVRAGLARLRQEVSR